MNLNESALRHCRSLFEQPSRYHVSVMRSEGGACLVDCGVHATGGLEAGRLMAEVCLAGLGRVNFVPGNSNVWRGLAVTVVTDHPRTACMASQYAGWQIAGDKYFAMGSGPMRAVRGKEKLFDEIGCREQSTRAIGTLEGSKLPPGEVCRHIASECSVDPDDITLLVAPTSSMAGTVQVVARSVETALHKRHELGFRLERVISGFGTAPLPPVATNDIAAIGRTNDAVLYGGEVTLWVREDDDTVAEIGAKVPSSASRDYGRPFAEIFAHYQHDFYRIDPLLFSPAVVTFVNLSSGRVFTFGRTAPEILAKSFGG